ncbi:hypothetical protein A1O7_06064 [Cladophialophora yegresii CBS 114405]|uniref:Uncharacterized protein n=1 Tax=Cladophialophora yegresii CBS 114405 TaxID=1182544 RepID=W9VSB4_9EURO|nr:uncharacterized protein A1O7_06064 [Cladophialophora yegresii CBS 114405]EXJ58637.1 hypothetical protein A1O7_06064 [Cladophialophora yegresii CBS 114405]
MAQLFQGPLARRPQLCHFRLFCEFNSLIRGRAGEIWLGSLFYAHLAENALRVERLSNIITSYNRLPIYHFTQPGRLYIVDEDLRLSELISTDEEGDLFRSRDNNLVYITWGHIVTGTVTDPFSVPGWLELSTIIRRDPQPQARTVPGPESEGSATTNLLTSRELGIVSLREAFRDVNQQFTAMAADMMALPTSHVLRTLRENDADIHHSEATIDHLFLGNASPGQDGLEIARECLARVHGRLFEVERYIIEEENLLLTAGRTFRAYSLRYERTRHRYFLKWVVAGLQEPQLRDRFRIPSSVQPAPIARPYEGQDPCPICYEAVEQPEEWLFPKAGTGMTCPWCRASVPMDFLGEVMESRVRELQCL